MTEEDRARIQAEHVARMAEMKERVWPKAFEAMQEEAAQVAEAYGLTPSHNEVVGRRKAGSEKRSRAVGRRASRPDPAPHLAPAISGVSTSSPDIQAPQWLPAAPCGSGDRLVHLDLHRST